MIGGGIWPRRLAG